MDLKIIEPQIVEIRGKLVSLVENLECYVFGSIVVNPALANDLDILILYNNSCHVDSIQREFIDLSKKYPLHLTFFLFSEEKEFDFVSVQNARLLFRL
jgi:hypothetical protein